MNDRVLVEALRARDPGARAALYDSYAESVYRYCWALLGNPDSAQVALRDTLIAAEAHAGSLGDPDRLRVWLLALARGECVRRRVPGGSGQADTEFSGVAVPPLSDPADADLRVVAWNAGRGLAPEDREVLELATRHGLSGADLAAVLGTGQRYAEALLEAATERLRDAITAEILVRKGPYDCPKRAKILAGFTGRLTPEMRDEVTRHLPGCVTCRPHRVRQVSVAKVFGLLPEVVLPETLRVRVMSCFADPELAPYRRYVAERVGALDATGFPAEVAAGPRWQQAVAGALAAVASVAIVALAFNQLSDGPEDRIVGIASGAFPATGEPPGIQVPWSASPEDMPMVLRPILDISPTSPIGSRNSAKPISPTTPGLGATPRPRPSGTGPHGSPSPAPSTAPPATPVPTETLPTETPTEIPTGQPTTGPTGGATGAPQPPRDHHHHPRPRRDCPPTNGPTPAPTAGSQTPAHTPAQAPADAPADPPSPPPSPAAPVAAEAVAPPPARETATDPSSGASGSA